MFTGLIKEIGKIKELRPNETGMEIAISCPKLISEIGIDDSVAVNGACLTATEIGEASFKTQAVHVTLEKTNLGKLQEGSSVNLELALRPSDRLGGHFVQGHVNTLATVREITNLGDNWLYQFEIDQEYTKYLISEGSIAINGVSLTLSHLSDNIFQVSIIPHTYQNTTFQDLRVGDTVNIEVDMLAKYVEKILNREKPSQNFNNLLKNLS